MTAASTWASSSALAPAGPQAARLAHLFWIFFWVCAAVYVVMFALLVVSLSRPPSPVFEETRRLRLVMLGGALTTLILVSLLGASVRAGHGLNPMLNAAKNAPAGAGDAITVRVTARQWWWEFQYPGAHPDERVTTANELHIPVGRPVLLELRSRDVIHSFWVPALHGKRDLIPGHDSTTYIQADQAGRYRGQCAEFCGAQHAKMGFLVVAEDGATFAAWLKHQRQAAAPPSTAAAVRGRALFLGSACPMCHTVSGTLAGATMGPDLTHVASRSTLGAGSIPNVRGHLAGWIIDSQNIKPGNQMPPVPLRGEELQDPQQCVHGVPRPGFRLMACQRNASPVCRSDHGPATGPRDNRCRAACPSYLDGNDAEADVIVTTLCLESKACCGAARPTIVQPAATASNS